MKNFEIEIHKFGGTSLGSPERIGEAASLIHQSRARCFPVAVASAMEGVTDSLEGILNRIGQETARTDFERLLEAHRRYRLRWAAGDSAPAIYGRAAALFDELTRHKRTDPVESAAARDFLSFGEVLAADLVAQALASCGRKATCLDAADFLICDGETTAASPQYFLGGPGHAELLAVLSRDEIPVVTGFRARLDHKPALLGRGGSDLTASCLSSILGATSVTIWTDVRGIRSADPRVVPSARAIPHLNYDTAEELAHCGARVLHPRAIEPARSAASPIQVRCAQAPAGASTRVDGDVDGGEAPCAMAITTSTKLSAVPGPDGAFRFSSEMPRATPRLSEGAAVSLVGPGLAASRDLASRWEAFFLERGWQILGRRTGPGGAGMSLRLDSLPDDATIGNAHREFLG